jgi:hypothetical protein
MIAIPLELETQITHLAVSEHIDTTTLLSRMIKVYQSLNIQRATQDEEMLFLRGVEASLAEEWLDEEDEANYRDL